MAKRVVTNDPARVAHELHLDALIARAHKHVMRGELSAADAVCAIKATLHTVDASGTLAARIMRELAA